jgi:2-polyprenyl-3-methyl-5-hydroxy-6-metoxy-1,4-benzoquinol methylase
MTTKPPSPERHAQFKALTYEGFRELARDPSLSPYEKIGFPDSYRQGKEELIYGDLLTKLPALGARGTRIVDIGAGCSDLPRMLIEAGARLDQHLHFIDSHEMLDLLPDSPALEKVAGRFPDMADFVQARRGNVDAVIVYSVLHYVFAEGNTWAFLDAALSMLAPGGAMLLGDIPNISKRRRFFASAAGIAHHKAYTGRDELPPVEFNRLEPGEIDDSVIMALLQRARAAGFDAYVVPQPEHLPMANRREDILVVRP